MPRSRWRHVICVNPGIKSLQPNCTEKGDPEGHSLVSNLLFR